MKLESHPFLGPPASLLVYAGFLAVRAGLLCLPDGLARAFGRAAGSAARLLLPGRARTARGNAAAALGADGSAAARASWRHVGEVLVEIVRASRIDWRSRVVFEGLEHVDAALAGGGGLIAVGAHLGNWEAPGLAMAARGYRMNTVIKRPRNARIARRLEALRRGTGQRTIDKKGALREAIRALRRNEILAMLADQHARHDAVEVAWFGRAAATYRTPALLSVRYRAPIVTFASPRLADGRFRVTIDPPFVAESTGDVEADVRRATERIVAALEKRIRETPGQWLWMHRRWRVPL